MNFLPESPRFPGQTFDSFVQHAANDANLGPQTAGRLMYFGDNILSSKTSKLLSRINGGEVPPRVSVIDPANLADSIAPLVRTIGDFEPSEQVRYHTADQASRWIVGTASTGIVVPIRMSKGDVWATERPVDSLSGDELEIQGRVILCGPNGSGAFLSPNWPALMTEALHTAIMQRKRSGLSNDKPTFRSFGRALTELSYFDPQAKVPSSNFYKAIGVTLRHLDTQTTSSRSSS